MRIGIIKRDDLDQFFDICSARGYTVDKGRMHMEIKLADNETSYCDMIEYDTDRYEILCHVSSNVNPDTLIFEKRTGDIVKEIIADIER